MPILGAVSEGRDHIVRTNLSEWDRALGGRSSASQSIPQSLPPQQSFSNPFSSYTRRTGSGGRPASGTAAAGAAGADGQPIQVIISEAWSWSKFSRKMGSRLLYGVLIMTGLSVVLDQQGIIKSAGMGQGEVEPTSVTQTITFADVQGVDEAKHELEEVVEFLKEPAKFMELGGKLPKGILLYGPPGTGKTHLARAVAGEAGVPFFQMSGSEFDELYVGVGARRVRELFAAAKKRSPCIVFIDELDAVGSKRSMKDQSYMRQTLNQLLVELDGFSPSEGVILIAATNTPDSLDKALVRPGRFDRLVPVPLPDVRGRSQILKVHMRGVQVDPAVQPDIIARGTPGFSGADLANLINQAAIRASKLNNKHVTMPDLEWAKDKIIMGSERKSAVITDESKRLTAYHEGGHTLVALYTQGAMPLHKVTVIPRGDALGVTVMLPEADQSSVTRRELFARMDVSMGGRVAEEFIFGADDVTTGAHSDLQNATRVARSMVLHHGMSDKVGLQNFNDEDFENASPETKALIEREIKAMLEASYARAFDVLRTHKDELHLLAKALIEYETLTADEVRTVIKGGDLGAKK
ncbi:peptidase family M41-domain-containing protein [Entophlyctis helioformis]|nr:peptidase family M41-domain-containing protein [Entophlyctis helioformis]